MTDSTLSVPSESDPSKTDAPAVEKGAEIYPVEQPTEQPTEQKPHVVLSEEVPSLAGN